MSCGGRRAVSWRVCRTGMLAAWSGSEPSANARVCAAVRLSSSAQAVGPAAPLHCALATTTQHEMRRTHNAMQCSVAHPQALHSTVATGRRHCERACVAVTTVTCLGSVQHLHLAYSFLIEGAFPSRVRTNQRHGKAVPRRRLLLLLFAQHVLLQRWLQCCSLSRGRGLSR